MDLRKFVDLYVTETEEHIRLLQRSLLALEQDGADAALAEAFRAAHTLKSLSAAMGYGQVAALAHQLEDQLDAVRSGRTPIDAAVDALLAEADALEAAIARALLTPPLSEEEQETADDNAATVRASAAAAAAAPPGCTTLLHVTLRRDAPIKSARALLIMRALSAHAGVLGSEPAEFADDFGGWFTVFASDAADATALTAAIEAAGDVADVRVLPLPAAQQPAALTPVATQRAGTGAEPARQRVQRQVRVDARRLDGLAESLGELTVLYGRLQQMRTANGGDGVVDRVGAVLSELEHNMRALRMVPLRDLFDRLPRVVRDAARASGRDVDLVLEGDDVELDRSILDEMLDPLVHLLRNAVDHGIESPADRVAAGKPVRGHIRVSAYRERSSVRITIADDGRGVSAERVAARAHAAGLRTSATPPATAEELFRIMCLPGLSTAEQVSTVSGRGVGMDVVVTQVRALGGAVDMRSEPGAGTVFTLQLPITLAVAQALRVRVGGEDYAIPITHVAEAVELGPDTAVAGGEMVCVRNRMVPLVRLRRVLLVQAAGEESAAVIAEIGNRRAALAVDELVGREQIVVRPFDAVTGLLPFFSGATLLADGRPALVLDPLSVL